MTTEYENFSFTILVIVAMSSLTFGIVVQNASATTSEIRMLADLNPPPGGRGTAAATADGRADYREEGSSMRLNVEVEDVTPNTTFTIEVSGNTLGAITTNSFGIAELELNTNDGHVVPKILRGDLVQIFQGSELVLSGSFDDEGDIEEDVDNQTPIIPVENITSNQSPLAQSDNSSINSSVVTTMITIPQDADDRGATGAYSPNPASVTDRSTVAWNNIDSTPHTATADDGSFDTGIINAGSSGSALIIRPSSGTTVIPYHCSVHSEMRGTLQVITLSTVPSSNSTLPNAPVSVTNDSSANATIQNLQQEIGALQQSVDVLQQALTSLQQAASQDGNVTVSANNNNTTATSTQDQLQQQSAATLPPQQMPESQQQQEQRQNQTVSIVPGSSTLAENTFQPNPVQVNIDDMVTWVNDDSQPHTVTSGSNGQPDNKFNSSPNFIPLMAPGATFSHTFTEAGEYPYFCLLHPNMIGTVSVVR
jgi:plastocyanin